MTAVYRLAKRGVIRISSGTHILPDRSSRAWNAYLAWVKAGGVAEPMIEPPPAPPPPPPTRDELDAAAARAYPELAALARMSPAEVVDYINRNVTSLAGAKTAITTLAVAVSILARRI